MHEKIGRFAQATTYAKSAIYSLSISLHGQAGLRLRVDSRGKVLKYINIFRLHCMRSLPSRGAWIETGLVSCDDWNPEVAPLTGGVD